MYSPDVIEKNIRAMHTEKLVERWRRNLFSEESRSIAESELLLRGINPDHPVIDHDPLPQESVSEFSINDLPIWRRLFTFKGRASRLKFWSIVPLTWLCFIFFGILIEVLFDRVSYPIFLLSVFGPLVPIAWIHWATVVQRLHDRNENGNRAWILFIPVIGPLWALVELGILPGTPGPNRFGRDSRY